LATRARRLEARIQEALQAYADKARAAAHAAGYVQFADDTVFAFLLAAVGAGGRRTTPQASGVALPTPCGKAAIAEAFPRERPRARDVVARGDHAR
jgi:hypothetical protein